MVKRATCKKGNDMASNAYEDFTTWLRGEPTITDNQKQMVWDQVTAMMQSFQTESDTVKIDHLLLHATAVRDDPDTSAQSRQSAQHFIDILQVAKADEATGLATTLADELDHVGL